MANETIGQFIKTRRVALGWTQGKLAGKSGASTSYIQKLEKGERTPTVPKLDRIITALDSNWLEFLRSTGLLPTKYYEDLDFVLKKVKPLKKKELQEEERKTKPKKSK